ncbi:thioredoxin family protein [Hyphomicrobium sp. DMF-1]|uniref:thioredoxin family protein n=1 Tax=Hyphomicrobium sp. DMF-1 TaxID=3019544 RepID=UPI0022EBB3D9|nr:thioredoxin family protein [Hyphomicrobium sp. DMF-1]WBT38017.1 thioredoxin family protein [Hyphomicrobium sp. DMF-1]
MRLPLALVAAALALTAMLGGLAAQAGENQKFEPAAFAAAQKAGKSILVHVTAPWCPTCKAQKPIIDELTAKPELKDLVVFEIDFDTGGAALKAVNARSQSTIVTYKGATETGRSVGDTNKDSVTALVMSAL